VLMNTKFFFGNFHLRREFRLDRASLSSAPRCENRISFSDLPPLRGGLKEFVGRGGLHRDEISSSIRAFILSPANS